MTLDGKKTVGEAAAPERDDTDAEERARRFMTTDATGLIVTPPPDGDTTAEDYKDYDWPVEDAETPKP